MSFGIGIPKGKTSSKWYGIGYQAAMQDIARELAEGGAQAVAEWLSNNNRNATPAESLALVAGPVDTFDEVASEYARGVEWNDRKFGELTPAERAQVTREVAAQMQAEPSSPAMAEALGADVPNAQAAADATGIAQLSTPSPSVAQALSIILDKPVESELIPLDPDSFDKASWAGTRKFTHIATGRRVAVIGRYGRGLVMVSTDLDTVPHFIDHTTCFDVEISELSL